MSTLPQAEPDGASAMGVSAAQLYERHRRRLVAFCTSQMGSREEGEDAVQDTFVYAMRALRRGVVPECELAWLFTIARNVCQARRRNGFRRSRVVVTRDLNALHDAIPARDHDHDRLRGLPEALAAMPDAQRQAILLREWQGLSYREIAHELELSQSAVETLLFRARRSLARALARPARSAASALNLPALVGALRSLLPAGTAKAGAGALTVAAAATLGAATVPALAGHGASSPGAPVAVAAAARVSTPPSAGRPAEKRVRSATRRRAPAALLARRDRTRPASPGADVSPDFGAGTGAAAGPEARPPDPTSVAAPEPSLAPPPQPRQRPRDRGPVLPATPPTAPLSPPPVVATPSITVDLPPQVEPAVEAVTEAVLPAAPLPPPTTPSSATPALELPSLP